MSNNAQAQRQEILRDNMRITLTRRRLLSFLISIAPRHIDIVTQTPNTKPRISKEEVVELFQETDNGRKRKGKRKKNKRKTRTAGSRQNDETTVAEECIETKEETVEEQNQEAEVNPLQQKGNEEKEAAERSFEHEYQTEEETVDIPETIVQNNLDEHIEQEPLGQNEDTRSSIQSHADNHESYEQNEDTISTSSADNHEAQESYRQNDTVSISSLDNHEAQESYRQNDTVSISSLDNHEAQESYRQNDTVSISSLDNHEAPESYGQNEDTVSTSSVDNHEAQESYGHETDDEPKMSAQNDLDDNETQKLPYGLNDDNDSEIMVQDSLEEPEVQRAFGQLELSSERGLGNEPQMEINEEKNGDNLWKEELTIDWDQVQLSRKTLSVAWNVDSGAHIALLHGRIDQLQTELTGICLSCYEAQGRMQEAEERLTIVARDQQIMTDEITVRFNEESAQRQMADQRLIARLRAIEQYIVAHRDDL